MIINKNQNPSAQRPVSIDDQPYDTCPICGSKYFKPVFVVKKVSALLSPTGSEALFAANILLCAGECGQEVYGIPQQPFPVVPLINEVAKG